MTDEQEKQMYNRYILQRAEAIKSGDAEALELYDYLDTVNYKLAKKNRPLIIPIIEQMFDKPIFIRVRSGQSAE